MGRLAPGHLALEHDRRQAVRGGIDGGRQSGRPGADDRQVVVARDGGLIICHASASLSHGRRGMTLSPSMTTGSAGLPPASASSSVGLCRAGLEPLVRLRHPRQEVAQPVVLGIEPSADEGHRRPDRARSDRPHRSLAAQDEPHLVDHAPRPVLARLDGAEDGMAFFLGVPARVPVRRGVAATDLAAGLAHPQMHP